MSCKVVLIVAALVAGARGYSSGAPPEVCQDMVPQHPVAPQKTPAPYVIATNTKISKAGQPIQVSITGKSADNTIKGFLLQARAADKPVGKFTIPPANQYAQPLNCGTPANAVTHKKNDGPSPNSLPFTWTPPRGFTGEIVFRSTVALNGGVFWVGVESAPVKIVN